LYNGIIAGITPKVKTTRRE